MAQKTGSNWAEHLLTNCKHTETGSCVITGRAASKNNPIAQQLGNPARMHYQSSDRVRREQAMYGIMSSHAQNVGGRTVHNMSRRVHSAPNLLGAHCGQAGILHSSNKNQMNKWKSLIGVSLHQITSNPFNNAPVKPDKIVYLQLIGRMFFFLFFF